MIEVEAPDGSVVEFPEGTAPNTIRQVMGKKFPTTSPTAPLAQPLNAAQTLLQEARGGLSQGRLAELEEQRGRGEFPGPLRFPLSRGMEGYFRGARPAPMGSEERYAAPPEQRRGVMEGLGMLPGGFAAKKVLGRAMRSGIGGGLGSIASETFDPSEDPMKAAALAAVTGAGGEAVGTGIAKIGGRILNPTAGKIVQGGKAFSEFLKQRGGVLLPGLASESRLVDIMQNVAESSLFGGGRIAQTRQEATDIFRESMNKFVDGLSGSATREEVGLVVTDAVENGLQAFKQVSSKSFQQVDNLLENRAAVNMAPIKELATEIIGLTGLRRANLQAVQLAKDVLEKGDVVTFAEAQAIRSDLLAIIRGAPQGIPGRGQAVTAAKRMAPMVDDAMEAAAKDIDPQALVVWRAANRFWKKGAEDFNSKLVKGMLNKDPELVVDFFAKPGRVTSIKRVRRILEQPTGKGAIDKTAWPMVQANFVEGLIKKSTNVDGDLIGKTFLRNIRKFKDTESLRELFPNKFTRDKMQFLAVGLAMSQGKATSEGAGRVAIQLMQPGAAMQVAGAIVGVGGFTATGTAIVVAPPVLSQIMSSRVGSKWLLEGIKAPPGSKEYFTAVTKLAAEVTRMQGER